VASVDADLRLRLRNGATDAILAESPEGETTLEARDLAAGVYYLSVESAAPATADLTYSLRATGVAGPVVSSLAAGAPVEDAFAADGVTHYFEFPVARAGSLVTVTLETEAALDLAVASPGTGNAWRNALPEAGSAPTATLRSPQIQFVAPARGPYRAEVSGGQAGDAFTILFDEGELAPVLPPGEAAWGGVDARERVLYRLAIDEPDQLLTVVLTGAAGSDLDLAVTGYDTDGTVVHRLASSGSGSSAAVSLAAAPPGLYEVAVDGGATGGDYFVLARLEEPAALGAQWAVAAQSGDARAAETAAVTGAPDVADSMAVWTVPANSTVSLTLTYAHAVAPRAVHVHTVDGAAALVAVEAYDADRQRWVTLWEAANTFAATSVPVAQLPLDPADFATDRIRLRLDTTRDDIAIDAVALYGLPR
jgi:hypothetical protein